MARRLNGSVPVVLHHHSGRPWVLATARPSEVVAHVHGRDRIALIGVTAVGQADLERIATSLRTPADLAAVGRDADGSFCTLGSLDGTLYASAPAFMTRRLFSATVDDVTVLSDRADVLAELGGFAVDPVALAMRLVGATPHPCDDVPVWSGVTPVPGDRYVTVAPDGRSADSTVRWRVPDPVLSRTEGALLLRERIAAAVDVRVGAGGAVAADLSGGLDSTPLCLFAGRGPSGVTARTLYNEDPGGREDLRWARMALEHMPGVHTHIVSSTETMPAFYEGLADVRVRFDEPTQAIVAGPRIQHQLADDAERGITLHLNGLGGDHLLRGLKGWHHSSFRTRPATAWRWAREEDASTGVGPLSTLRQLLDRRSYGRWLVDAVRTAAGDVAPPVMPATDDWAPPPSLPPWLTDDAREAVVQRLLEASEHAWPHAPDRAGHLDVSSIRDAARLVRATGQLGRAFGVAYEAPLLDDRVVDAVLAVRRDERDSPLEWKPLMKEAMRDLLPEDYLRRTSKVGGSPQSARGYARHHESVVELVEGSGLVESGVVDMDRFRRFTAVDATGAPSNRIYPTITTAGFLRNLRGATHVAA